MRAAGSGRRFLVSLGILLCLIAVPTFAGGSSGTAPQTFGSYQVDFDLGPVGLTIQGHASTQVVRVSEQSLPKGITVHYAEQGGILHVTTSTAEGTTVPSKPGAVGRLTVTMPRYEFVHIKTTSGAVSINNLSTDHLTIQTATGGIDVVNTNAALKVQSTTGNQSYTQIYGAIDAGSTTGDMSIAHTWGVVNVKSTGGSVEGQDVNLAGNSTFQTQSGTIKVGLTYGLSQYRYAFDLRSAKGKLQLGDIIRNGGEIRWGEGNIQVSAVTGSGSQYFH